MVRWFQRKIRLWAPLSSDEGVLAPIPSSVLYRIFLPFDKHSYFAPILQRKLVLRSRWALPFKLDFRSEIWWQMAAWWEYERSWLSLLLLEAGTGILTQLGCALVSLIWLDNLQLALRSPLKRRACILSLCHVDAQLMAVLLEFFEYSIEPLLFTWFDRSPNTSYPLKSSPTFLVDMVWAKESRAPEGLTILSTLACSTL